MHFHLRHHFRFPTHLECVGLLSDSHNSPLRIRTNNGSPTEQAPANASSNRVANSRTTVFFDTDRIALVTITNLNAIPMILRNVGNVGNVKIVTSLVRELIVWRRISVLAKIGMLYFLSTLLHSRLTSET